MMKSLTFSDKLFPTIKYETFLLFWIPLLVYCPPRIISDRFHNNSLIYSILSSRTELAFTTLIWILRDFFNRRQGDRDRVIEGKDDREPEIISKVDKTFFFHRQNLIFRWGFRKTKHQKYPIQEVLFEGLYSNVQVTTLEKFRKLPFLSF